MGPESSIFSIVDIPEKEIKEAELDGVQALTVCLTCTLFPKERSIANMEHEAFLKSWYARVVCHIISVLFCLSSIEMETKCLRI